MTPSLAVPTDNIYKFVCLFGLTLVIASIFAFVTAYVSTLDRKVGFSEVIIPLEAKQPRTKVEDDLLALNKKLLELTQANEKAANHVISGACGAGLALSLLGALRWYSKVQKRDDRLVQLQMQKLELEIAKLSTDVAAAKESCPESNEVTVGEGAG